MRLLLDEQLSEAILGKVCASYPGTVHVRRAMRTGADDAEIWNFARAQGYVLVTRDEDFERMSALRGAPPKVVLLTLHNPRNAEAVALLLSAHATIAEFVADETAALLMLGRPR